MPFINCLSKRCLSRRREGLGGALAPCSGDLKGPPDTLSITGVLDCADIPVSILGTDHLYSESLECRGYYIHCINDLLIKQVSNRIRLYILTYFAVESTHFLLHLAAHSACYNCSVKQRQNKRW